MGKRGGFPGGMVGFGGMNINQLMKEAKKMQADMEKSQEELGSKEIETTAGRADRAVADARKTGSSRTGQGRKAVRRSGGTYQTGTIAGSKRSRDR